jgi:hypothetical protein
LRQDLPFIGSLSDVPGNPADSISVRLNPAECQPLSFDFIYTKQLHVTQVVGVLFFGAEASFQRSAFSFRPGTIPQN